MTNDPTYVPNIAWDATSEIMRGRAVHGNVYFEMPFITRVDGNLWQGGCERGLKLPDNFRHVISLYKWEDYEHGPLDTHKVVTMYDGNGVADAAEVDELASLVNELLTTGDDVLVHCQAGLNRSSLIVARSLMIRDENPLTADEAIALIRERRSPACLCNPSFETWLRNR